MFKEIRGSVLGKDVMSKDEMVELVKNVVHGTLSMNGPDGYPKSVPMSLLYDGEYFYFHCNKYAGEKMELLKENSKVCLSIFQMEKPDGVKRWIFGKSIVAYGNATEIQDEAEMVATLRRLAVSAGMDFKAKDEYVLGPLKESVTVYKVTIEQLTSRILPLNAMQGAVEDFLEGRVKFNKEEIIYENN